MPRRVRLVLLHGSQVNRAVWTRYAGLLGPHVELVAPDLPAHGARRGEPFTWEGALQAVTTAVGEPDGTPVVLAGHSLGGYLALAWAGRHPHRLAGLALLGASAVPTGPGALLYRVLARVEHRLGADRMARGVDRELAALLPSAVAAAVKDAGYGFDGIPDAWSAVMRECRPELLTEVTAPVLLVNGQLDQLRIDARRFRRAARSAPWVRVVTVPRGLHVFPLTHPAETVAALWELLAWARRFAPAAPPA
ncbi:alpha/beta hydrolase [Phycicoccus endophyticus]|uniref:Alpha/beta hydrolase n=1 Tax=Phycicoccus endophyticus TaxID=1690220 RepID=A0A7G9R3X6_9MICO|nr:alpha/beta hydrolase [Phycicoccus endophyticus]NHI18135.1 alpha/beta hydrolase [Phycicoccus endophyticus]QNN50301.1 alpha/beta hydrolase [Phycicoccus endophyticus]GGL26174.1 lysophospholipase [Phycicoccus endophyticus]